MTKQKQPTLKELEEYFNDVKLPKGPIRINSFTIISNIRVFLNFTFKLLKKNKGNAKYYPYYKQLIKIKEIIASQ